MGKPNKRSIIAALNELETLYTSRTRIEAKRQKELAPFIQTFEESVEPINDKFNKQLSPVQERIAALEKEVEAGMLASEQEDGTLKLPRVESDELVATATANTTREVDAKVFFDALPESKRDSVFWSCYKVLIKNAEKLLGKVKLDSIATLKRNWSVKIEKKAK